ncbi:HGxxPAAW family protein [Demequina muriae]|uniref:HGxxPAAW family protein n=1 Tax=Demequina muriae TaxID=3051664 RepID=A0ABT8GDB5_9MICO|nr:HGxxPAAW family protein [Demequina sp. EGI L300058]MDN4479334.1 HGxxPAAW family protein [Demequina sp. EGI L300058]
MSSIEIAPEDLPDEAHSNHGKTTAGWVTNVGLVVAALVASIGIAFPVWPVVWVGVGLAVVALAAGASLRALGHGQPLK